MVRSSWRRLITEGPVILTLVSIQAVSAAHDTPLGLWVVERLFTGYRDI